MFKKDKVEPGMIFEVKEQFRVEEQPNEKWLVLDVEEDSCTLQYLSKTADKLFYKTKDNLLAMATFKKKIRMTDTIRRNLLRRRYELQYKQMYRDYMISKENLDRATIDLSIAIMGVDPKEFAKAHQKSDEKFE